MNQNFYEEVAGKFIFKVKKGLLYTENDVWVKRQKNGCLIGVTDFLQRRSGDLTFVELPKIGGSVRRGDEIASMETIKAVVSIASPLDCFIEGVNSKLKDRPELVNEEPYGEGWIVLVSPTHLKEDKQYLMTAEEYFELMKSEIEKEQEKNAKKEL